MNAPAKLPEGWKSNHDLYLEGLSAKDDAAAPDESEFTKKGMAKTQGAYLAAAPGPEADPDKCVPTSEIEIDTAEKALPLFEARVEGLGVVFLEAISQAALVDYIEGVLWYPDEPKPLAPFRAEYLRHVEDPGTKKFTTTSARSTIFLDPARIIMIGPEKRTDGSPPPDENGGAFQRLLEEIAAAAPSARIVEGPAEVILLDDRSGGGEDGPK